MAAGLPSGSAQLATTCAVNDVPGETGTDHTVPASVGATDAVTGFPQIDIVTACFQEDATTVAVTITLAAAPAPGGTQQWTYVASFQNATGGQLTCTHIMGTGPATTGCTAAVSGAAIQFKFLRPKTGPVGATLSELFVTSHGYFVAPNGDILTSNDRAPNTGQVFPQKAPYTMGTRAPPDLDSDHDGVPDRAEIANHTNPNSPDTDHDGLLDGAGRQAASGSANATLFNALQIYQPRPGYYAGEKDYGTNATRPDTDGDGLLDGGNITVPPGSRIGAYFANFSLSPISSDASGDLYLGELGFGANPLNPDTDADGLTDREEVTGARNTRFPTSHFQGFPGSTDPRVADTDHDGITDGAELARTPPTNPNERDTDHDGLTDGEEIKGHVTIDGRDIDFTPTDPTNPDTDGDGVNDYDEVRLGSLATDPHSKPGGNNPGGAEAGYLVLSTIAMLIVILLCVIGILVRWG
jgi:hypothetical protein